MLMKSHMLKSWTDRNDSKKAAKQVSQTTVTEKGKEKLKTTRFDN